MGGPMDRDDKQEFEDFRGPMSFQVLWGFEVLFAALCLVMADENLRIFMA